jgi:hypothetical protein
MATADNDRPQLQETLDALKKQREALESEFKLAQDDPIKLRDATQKGLYELGPEAIATLGELMVTSDSQTTRAKIATFVVGTILDGKTGADAEMALNSLLTRLSPASQ